MGPHDDVDDVDDDVVRRVEDVWSSCTLKKVDLEFIVGLQLFITDYFCYDVSLYDTLISMMTSHNGIIFRVL